MAPPTKRGSATTAKTATAAKAAPPAKTAKAAKTAKTAKTTPGGAAPRIKPRRPARPRPGSAKSR